MEDSPIANINIQLGDIIKLVAPDNKLLDEQMFYIKYIDFEKIVVINSNTEDVATLVLDNGEFVDKSIESIELISSPEYPGYAMQHDLEPGVWIQIHFKGPDGVPFIVTGQITNLEEDSIEIKTYPKNETIYIDFEYKGIPEDLFIEEILITNPPTISKKLQEEKVLSKEALPLAEGTVQEEELAEGTPLEDDGDGGLGGLPLLDDIEFGVGLDEDPANVSEIILDADDIEFGVELEEMELIVEVPESEKRFSVDRQTNDILDALLAEIPTYKRTASVMNNIHTMIERYVQLRSIFSKLDENGNLALPDELKDSTKPIIKTLINLNKAYAWLLPVSYNRKKLYDVDIEGILDENTIDPIDLDKSLEEQVRIIEQYTKNRFHDDENKYVSLFTDLNSFFTPFSEPEFPQHSIESGEVNTNILSVVSNLGDLSSYVTRWFKSGKARPEPTWESSVEVKKFLLDTYTIGLTYLNDDSLVALTPADTINIRSIVTLTIPTMLFSRINLPTTNILDRSMLNKIGLDYWKLLYNKDIESIIIENFDPADVLEYQDYEVTVDPKISELKKTFLQETRQYMLDEQLSGETDKYDKLLNLVLPTNLEAFHIFKKYIPDNLSVYSAIKFLEIFNIYHQDITTSVYTAIVKFTENNIVNYKKQLEYNKKAYGRRTLKSNNVPLPNNLLKFLSSNEDIYTIILNSYNFDRDKYYSNLEIINRINIIDNGRLFALSIVKINLDLQMTNIVNDFVKKYKKLIAEKKALQNKCKIISNKYESSEALLADNNKEIYFDAKYDKTNYKILNKLDTQRADLTDEDFKKLLVEILASDEKLDMSPEEIIKEVDILLGGKKPVEDGDYAILVTPSVTPNEPPEIVYYVRKTGVWLEDKEMIGDVKIDDNKLFCNLQPDCVSKDDKCSSMIVAENEINQDTLLAIYKEFDETYTDDQAQTNEDSTLKLLTTAKRVEALKMIEKVEFYKYNEQKKIIGYNINDDSESAEQIISSPYENLRDVILGQGDFIKKQHDIQKLVNYFMRQPYATEDQHWLYCIETSVKLLPMFLSELANVYVSRGNYLYKLDMICKDQGTISEDGDAWVDKHSGYFIKNIDLDTEEGFTAEGFKDRSREVLKDDLVNAVLTNIKKSADADADANILSPESEEEKKIKNIVGAISGFMSIDLNKEMNFIVNSVISIHQKGRLTKAKYDKKIKAAQEQGKTKFSTYENSVNELYLLITFVFILIAIQISIPSIKTRLTFPGCKKAFTGYPLLGEEKTAIQYIACVANKIKSNIEPWNAIKGMKPDSIVKRMESLIDKYKIISLPNVVARVYEKYEFLKTTKADAKEAGIEIQKLTSFFPPLVPFTIHQLTNISPSFKKTLISNLKSGYNLNQDQAVLQEKIVKYGLAIQEEIKKIVDKKPPLRTNNAMEPFLENACCESISPNVYEYLVENSQHIRPYNKIVQDLSQLLNDIIILARAPLLYDPRDTRQPSPEISGYFSKNTIYRAFIVFCNRKDLLISEELREVCHIGKEDYVGEESIDAKIEDLKKDGINYSEELLQKLLAVVNLRNTVNMNLTLTPPDSIQKINTLLLNIKEDVSLRPYIPEEFVDLFYNLLDRFSLTKMEGGIDPSLRAMKDYLGINNRALTERIETFVKTRGDPRIITKSKFAKFYDCYTSITEFGDSQEDIFKMMLFINNSLRNIVDVFPNIIINKLNFSDVDIPKHWKLSKRHISDLKKLIGKYYTSLVPLYDQPLLDPILTNIQNFVKHIQLLAEYTPYYPEILDKDHHIHSIFDKKIVSSLFKYYFLLILNNYITLYDENVSQGVGEQEQIGTALSEFLLTIMGIICKEKETISVTNEMIMRKILKSKEQEKDEITSYLESMSDEQREVENVFKSQKLGKWGKGLQKGLTQYVGDTYDQEREEDDERAIKAQKLADRPDVIEEEFDQEGNLAADIDAEVADLENYGGEDDNADDAEPDEDGEF